MNYKKLDKTSWKTTLRGILKRFLIMFLSITILATIGLVVSYRVSSSAFDFENVAYDFRYTPKDLKPMEPEYENYTVLFDGHSHTFFSDGSVSPRKNIEWHIANGYNAIVVTDHNNLEGAQEAQRIAREEYADKIVVLLGEEWSSCRIHMGLIGITEKVPSYGFPTDEQIQETINLTHAQGGIAVVNHRPWSINGGNSLTDHPTLEQLFEWGIDYVEIANGGTLDYEEHGLGILTGTDMHVPGRVNGWTTLIPKNFTEEAVMEALRERKTSAIFTAMNSPYHVEPEWTNSNIFLDPFFRVGSLVRGYYIYSNGMYSFNHSFCRPRQFDIRWTLILIFVVWLIICFVILESVRWGGNVLYSILRRKKIEKDSFDDYPLDDFV